MELYLEPQLDPHLHLGFFQATVRLFPKSKRLDLGKLASMVLRGDSQQGGCLTQS